MATGLNLKSAAGQADLPCPGFLTDPNAYKEEFGRTVRSLIRASAQDTDSTQQPNDPNMGFAHSEYATGRDGVDGAGAVVINKQLQQHYDDLVHLQHFPPWDLKYPSPPSRVASTHARTEGTTTERLRPSTHF